jgi:hypothetical protein
MSAGFAELEFAAGMAGPSGPPPFGAVAPGRSASDG